MECSNGAFRKQKEPHLVEAPFYCRIFPQTSSQHVHIATTVGTNASLHHRLIGLSKKLQRDLRTTAGIHGQS